MIEQTAAYRPYLLQAGVDQALKVKLRAIVEEKAEPIIRQLVDELAEEIETNVEYHKDPSTWSEVLDVRVRIK